MAAAWSQALAAEGRNSPDEDVDAIRRVTVADVNRVAKQYLVASNSITATLVPKPSSEPVASKGFGGGEQMTPAPTKPVTLPSWADSALSRLAIPRTTAMDRYHAAQSRPAHRETGKDESHHYAASATCATSRACSRRSERTAWADVLEELFSYGTTTLDRLAFQKALDDIAASESAGYDFSVRVLKTDFSRGVELLADNVLRPALPADAFAIVKRQTAEFVAGQQKSPGYKRPARDGDRPAAAPRPRPAGGDARHDLVAHAR